MKENSMRLGLFLLMLLLAGTHCIAQSEEVEEVDGEVEDAEIVIEKNRNLSMPTIRKIVEKIDIETSEPQTSVRPHTFKRFDYKSKSRLESPQAIAPIQSESAEVYDNYLRAGFGNFTSPLLQGRLGLPTDESRSLGIRFNHLSFGSGPIDGENSASSQSDATIFGDLIGERTRLSASVKFTATKDYFYGYSDQVEVLRDTMRHNYTFLGAKFGLNDVGQNEDLTYKTGIEVRSVSDNFNVSENTIGFHGEVAISNQLFLNARFDVSKYQDTNEFNRNHFRLTGFYRLKPATSITVDAGLMVSTQNDDQTSISNSQVFPYLKGKYSLGGGWNLEAGLDGGYRFNTYYDLAEKNRFLGRDITVQNSERKFRSHLGLAGNFGQKVQMKSQISLTSLANLQQLNNDFAGDSTRFEVLYDTGNTNVLTFEGSLTYRSENDHLINLNAIYTNYSTTLLDQALHLPAITLSLSGEHPLMEAVSLNWSMKYLAGIRGYHVTGSAFVDLSPIAELNLGLNYQFSKRAGAFLSIDNVLNQEFERYLNYPSRGVQVKAGLSYRF